MSVPTTVLRSEETTYLGNNPDEPTGVLHRRLTEVLFTILSLSISIFVSVVPPRMISRKSGERTLMQRITESSRRDLRLGTLLLRSFH